MSLRTTCTRLGTSVLGSCRTLVLADAVVLLVGVSCTSATIDSTPQAAGEAGGEPARAKSAGGAAVAPTAALGAAFSVSARAPQVGSGAEP